MNSTRAALEIVDELDRRALLASSTGYPIDRIRRKDIAKIIETIIDLESDRDMSMKFHK